MSLGWNFIGLPTARPIIDDHFSFFVQQASGFTRTANDLISQLQDYDIEPIDLGNIPDFSVVPLFTPFDVPEPVSEFTGAVSLTTAPQPIVLANVDLAGLDRPQLRATAPQAPSINIPSAPTIGSITFAGTAPNSSELRVEPVPDLNESALALPAFPLLETNLGIPPALQLELDKLDVDRPDFVNPLPYIYNNDYVRNANESRAAIFSTVDEAFFTAEQEHNLRNSDGSKAMARLGAMLDGGTGLPPSIEQALFDRAFTRDEKDNQVALAQSYEDWAARGFTLPGATLLRRVSELRQSNRDARAAAKREITIQLHQQEIENLRFGVQQGIALQGQVFDQYIQLHAAGRDMANRAFEVARAIFDARLEVFRTELQIYQADIQAFSEKLRGELAKVEIYKGQLEGARLRGELNEQQVRIYTARVSAIDTIVNVFRSRVEANKVQLESKGLLLDRYRTELDIHRALVDNERLKLDVFQGQVRGEEARANVFTSQVQGFAGLVNAFQAEVGAERSKVDAGISLNESKVREYDTKVQAWSREMATNVEELQAQVNVYQANIQRYSAELSAEEARVTGEARNSTVLIEGERARLQAVLQNSTLQVEQLRHVTSLGLSSIQSATQAVSQLAASAMSAVNVSASMSDTFGTSSSHGSGYTESRSISE